MNIFEPASYEVHVLYTESGLHWVGKVTDKQT